MTAVQVFPDIFTSKLQERRDCIAEKAGGSFNCRNTCEGIFADGQWIPEASHMHEDIEEGLDKNNLMRLVKDSTLELVQIYSSCWKP